MHIAEGVLSPAVLAGGAVLALAQRWGCANWSMIVWWLWGFCQRLFL